jgi:hypothetical protein
MKRQRVRVELWLNGELQARYAGRYRKIGECAVQPPPAPQPSRHPAVRKDHNAGGKSRWMEGFWNQPSPPLWKVIDAQ